MSLSRFAGSFDSRNARASAGSGSRPIASRNARRKKTESPHSGRRIDAQGLQLGEDERVDRPAWFAHRARRNRAGRRERRGGWLRGHSYSEPRSPSRKVRGREPARRSETSARVGSLTS